VLVLFGSPAHVLDEYETTAPQGFPATALSDYTRRVVALPDEAALADPPELAGQDPAAEIRTLFWSSGGWSRSAALRGLARVLAVVEPYVLATPLYLEHDRVISSAASAADS
jgi:hypothetical protein